MLTNVTELISRSCKNYINYWKYFLPFVLLMIATGVGVFIAGYIGIEIELHLKGDRLINDIIILLIYIASLIFSIWITIGIIQISADILSGRTPRNWKDIFRENNHLIIPVIVNSILVTLLIALGSILLIIPGIIFFVWYNFATYSIILDRKNWKEAFSFSKYLVVGRWWSVAWRIFAIMVFFSLISLLLQFIIVLIVENINASAITLSVISNSISSLINIIMTPLIIGALVGLYVSARDTKNTTTPPQTL